MAAYHDFVNPRLMFFEKFDLLAKFVERNVNRHGYGFTNTALDPDRVVCFAGYVGENTDRAIFGDSRQIDRV